MTEKAHSDLRELRKIGRAHGNPTLRFKSVWRREPLGAAVQQYKFEQDL